MISKRTHPEGSDAARDNTLNRPGAGTRLDARSGHAPDRGAAMHEARDDAAGRDAGTRYVVPNAIDRDDER
jgi:hypothetical protein